MSSAVSFQLYPRVYHRARRNAMWYEVSSVVSFSPENFLLVNVVVKMLNQSTLC